MAEQERKKQETLEAPAIEAEAEYHEMVPNGPKMPAVAPVSPEQSELPPVPPTAAKDKGEVGREGNGKSRRTVTRR
jgi:hypothetical protein